MFDVDEPISDYQKAIRERAAQSLGNLQHALSSPVKSPPRKDEYSASVARLKSLLKQYDGNKRSEQQHPAAGFHRSSDPYGASGPRITAEGHPRTDEVASLMNEYHAVLQHLEGQVEYYKNALAALKQRSELVIKENETLYEQLKAHAVDQILQDEPRASDQGAPCTAEQQHRTISQKEVTSQTDLTGAEMDDSHKQTSLTGADLDQSHMQTSLTGAELDQSHMQTSLPGAELDQSHMQTSLSTSDSNQGTRRHFHSVAVLDDSQLFLSQQERKFVLELEDEVDKIRKLHEAKTRQLEALLYSTRDELEDYQRQVAELQYKLRAQELVGNQPGKPTLCVKCAQKEAVLSTAQSEAAMQTINKLTRDRDEIMESLTRQKATLGEVRQRELEAYVQVKKSVDTVEQAQLEKAEAIIHVQQLKAELRQQKERHEKSLSNSENRRRKQSEEIHDKHNKQVEELSKKLETLSEKHLATENQLERLTREKVDLTAELEKARSKILAHAVDMAKMSEEIRSEMADTVVKYNIASQEISSLKASAQQTAKDRDQERSRLTAEMNELRRRLQEAEGAWMEHKEECIRLTEKVDHAERESKIVAVARENSEKARREDARSITQQAQQREQQLTFLLQQAESRHAQARVELEQMLEAQIQVSNRLKEECKTLTDQLQELAEKTRSELKEAGHECGKLREKLQESLKKHKTIEAQCLQKEKTIEKLTSKLKHSDSAAKKYVQQVYELLTKQNSLMKDRQMLCRELEYLRSQSFVSRGQRDLVSPLGTESNASVENKSAPSYK